MALREAAAPTGVLYRIGRAPDPLAWTEWTYVGEGRFDGPRRPRTFRVLYLAEQRLACFVETLANWRPQLATLAALEEMPAGERGDDVPATAFGVIPRDWHLKRRIGGLQLAPSQRWLDLREHETREAIRLRLAPTLRSLGYKDFDLGDALSRDRRLTKSIARFAQRDGFQGIVYKSRFDYRFDCWAVFEGVVFSRAGESPISRDDADLLEAARRLGLKL